MGLSQRSTTNDQRLPLDLLQSLHIAHARNLPQAVDDRFQVFEITDIEDDLDHRLTVCGAGFDVADVGFGVANHARDLLQHAVTVIAKDRQLDRIDVGCGFVFCPGNVYAPLRLIHEIDYVWTADGMHGHALAASYVADYSFSADRVTTARPIDQQITGALHGDGVVVSAEHP